MKKEITKENTMKKTKELSYKDYVELGKQVMSEIKCYQVQIAFYATKVCEIKHGGRTRSTTYTLTKYAADIGINRKTLSEWVSVYRNVIAKMDKDIKDVTPKDWSIANKVQSLLNEEKRTVQFIMGDQGKKTKGTRSDVSPARIKDLFNQNYDGPSFQAEIYNWNDYIIFVKNKIFGRDLSLVSTSSLLSLKENLDLVSDKILAHLVKPSYIQAGVIEVKKPIVMAQH